MKTNSLPIFILLFFVFHSGFGQIKIGGNIAANLANVHETSSNIYSTNFESSTGYIAGLFSEISVNDAVAIRLEALYTRHGGRRDGLQPVITEGLIASGADINELNMLAIASGGSAISDATPLFADYSRETKINYVEIPLLLRYKFGDKKQFFVEAGPYVGFLLDADEVTLGTSTFFVDEAGNLPLQVPNPFGTPSSFRFPERSFNSSTEITDNLESTNYGIQFGVGASKIYDNKHEIAIGLRANYGFVPIERNETFGENRIASISISFSYGYIFNSKK